jgi:16S rRNA (guanine527-N7)-methyltransferase
MTPHSRAAETSDVTKGRNVARDGDALAANPDADSHPASASEKRPPSASEERPPSASDTAASTPPPAIATPMMLSPAPPVAAEVFGARLPVAERYAQLLATDGVVRGLIGPREAPRLWERHLLNCAVLAEVLPDDSDVIDVGSGAGLPGLVLAIARPDLRITLLEPLARRVTFLSEVTEELALANVTVIRGRAEESSGKLSAAVVTARAVAPLDRLARWCLPLAAPGGRLLAMKGSGAAEEIAESVSALRRAGGGPPRIFECGKGVVDPPTVVVEVPLLGASPRRGGRRSRQGD